MSYKEKINKNIKLTITMLVSNRKDTIRKCMDSIDPILKQIPSELIVVDTGSMDGSIDIVREYTDKIVPFIWCNDFSAARNAGLKDARGEWVMFLDDDEWFEDVTEIIDFFNSGEYRQYNRGVYIARNYGDINGRIWSDSNALRMVKRCPVTEFRGKVHEYIWPQAEPTKYFQAYVHHYGYVFSTEEERKKHSKRNITLLEEELKADPKDLRLRIQAVQEYFGTGEMRKVQELCQGVLDEFEETRQFKAYAGYCSNYMLRAYIVLEDWENAYIWGSEQLAKGVTTSITLLGNVREMIKICRMSKRYKEGIRCLRKYLEVFDILSKKIDREDVLLDLSKYLQINERERVYQEGIALGVLGEDLELVRYCLKAHNWDKEELLLYPDTLDFLLQYLSDATLKEEYYEIFYKLLEREKFYPQLEKIMDSYCKDEKKYKNLLSLFGNSEKETALVKKYRFYFHMLYACDWSKEKAEQELKAFLEKISNPLLMEDVMWKIIRENEICMDEILGSISYTRWFVLTRAWMEQGVCKKIDIKYIYDTLEVYKKDDLRYQFMQLKYKEYEICKKDADRTIDETNSLLNDYCVQSLKIFSAIYNSFVFQEEYITLLPPEGTFAFYMRKAFDRKNQNDIQGYRKLLVKAGQEHPGMKEICKQLLKQEQENKRQNKEEKREFINLAEQIKNKVRTMIQNGNYEVAKIIIEQLEKLLPDDEDVENFKMLIG